METAITEIDSTVIPGRKIRLEGTTISNRVSHSSHQRASHGDDRPTKESCAVLRPSGNDFSWQAPVDLVAILRHLGMSATSERRPYRFDVLGGNFADDRAADGINRYHDAVVLFPAHDPARQSAQRAGLDAHLAARREIGIRL